MPSLGRTWFTYTALRLAVFTATAALLFLVVRLNGFPLLLAALLVSSITSLFLLRAQREALVAAQQERVRRRAEERDRQRARLDQEPGG